MSTAKEVHRPRKMSPSYIRRKIDFISRNNNPYVIANAIFELRTASRQELIKASIPLEPITIWSLSCVRYAMKAKDPLSVDPSPKPPSKAIQCETEGPSYSRPVKTTEVLYEDLYSGSFHQLAMLLELAKSLARRCIVCHNTFKRYTDDAYTCIDCVMLESRFVQVPSDFRKKCTVIKNKPQEALTPVTYEQLISIPPNERYKYVLKPDDKQIITSHACAIAPARTHQLFTEHDSWAMILRMLPAYEQAWNSAFRDYGLSRIYPCKRPPRKVPSDRDQLLDQYSSCSYLVKEGCELCLKLAHLSDEFVTAVKQLR